jgi:Domain of unknown function (DUF4328)
MEELRPNGERAKWAILWVKVYACSLILILILRILGFYFNPNVFKFKISENFYLYLNEKIVFYFSYLNLGFSVISIVFFIKWFRRAYFNLQRRVSNVSFEEHWSALSWFIPLINLYRPYVIMKELFIATKFQLNDVNKDDLLDLKIVNIWWFLFIFDRFGFRIFGVILYSSRVMNYNSFNIDIFNQLYVFGLLITTVSLTFYTLKLIRNYSKAEELLIISHDPIQASIDSIGNN